MFVFWELSIHKSIITATIHTIIVAMYIKQPSSTLNAIHSTMQNNEQLFSGVYKYVCVFLYDVSSNKVKDTKSMQITAWTMTNFQQNSTKRKTKSSNNNNHCIRCSKLEKSRMYVSLYSLVIVDLIFALLYLAVSTRVYGFSYHVCKSNVESSCAV